MDSNLKNHKNQIGGNYEYTGKKRSIPDDSECPEESHRTGTDAGAPGKQKHHPARY